MVDIHELLREPTEVWRAVEGDPTELVALLRGGEPIPKRVRESLADYLEGKLTPVKRPKGRPSKALTQSYILRAGRAATYGHDTTTHLGYAGFVHEHFRRFIRKKGWHKKSAGKLYWSADRLREKVAERCAIEDIEKFINYLNRPKPKPTKWNPAESTLRRRIEIADEVYHKKNGPKR